MIVIDLSKATDKEFDEGFKNIASAIQDHSKIMCQVYDTLWGLVIKNEEENAS